MEIKETLDPATGLVKQEIEIELDTKQAFLIQMMFLISYIKIGRDKGKLPKDKERANQLLRMLKEMEEAHSFIQAKVEDLKIDISEGINKPKVTYSVANEGATEDIQVMTGIISSDWFMIPVSRMFGKEKEYRQELQRQEAAYLGKNKKFKRSGHLTDQLLKYSYNEAPTLFDELKEKTREKIDLSNIQKEEIVEGIRLSSSEQKVIDCLVKLLHQKSQTLNAKEDNYYSGNRGVELISYSGEMAKAPKLGFTLYELTQEYKGGEDVSGKDVENVKRTLQELDKKQFLLIYKETAPKKDGGRIERSIEEFRKLIHIVTLREVDYSKENKELSRTEETIVLLNPIFIRQIDTKFISYPGDINRRTIIAYGSQNVSVATFKLRDYLMREISMKRYKSQISVDKLYHLVGDKFMKEYRKKKVKTDLRKAIETVTTLGLLQKYEERTGATGEPIAIFHINKDWE